MTTGSLIPGVTFLQFDSLPSTNSYLATLPVDQEIYLCLAKEQTEGRGRQGKLWHSPKNNNLYFSLLWPHHCSKLAGLSLVVGLSLAQTLKRLYPLPALKLKWPNDLYYEEKKLAGILIESPRASHLIIGIGLNTHESESQWTCLNTLLGHPIETQTLLIHLVEDLLANLKMFEKTGFAFFQNAWNELDYLYGRPIEFIQGTKTGKGTAQGVEKDGCLRLVDKTGQVHQLHSGEIKQIRASR